MRLRSLALLPLLAAVVGGVLTTPAAASTETRPYIVVLKDSVAHPSDVAAEHRRRHGARVTHTYGTALKGYAASLSGAAYGEVVRDPRVAYVEADGVVSVNATEQTLAPWGLDRIDQPRGTNGRFTYNSTASGVTAYVLDTGIRASHVELAGRVTTGHNTVADGAASDDCNGHGTFVAGVIGGTTHGVAKGVTLVPVRVMDCQGTSTWASVIGGVDWVTQDHAAGVPAVANMSMGGGAMDSFDAAVKASIADGVTYTFSAGNGNSRGQAQDACNQSPGRVAAGITVSATDQTDTKASWANYGKCVDLFAPGVGITSAWMTDDTATHTGSGTSASAPYAAGVAALYLQTHPSASPENVRNALFNASTKNVVLKSRTTNAHLLFTSY